MLDLDEIACREITSPAEKNQVKNPVPDFFQFSQTVLPR
jgi:hypothetical protein